MGQMTILVNIAGITRDGLFMRMKTRLGAGPERQSHLCLPSFPRRFEGDDEAPFGPSFPITSVVGVTGNPGQGNYAAPRPHDRHDQIARGGSRQPQHHRELRCARLHCEPHDRCAQREAKEASLSRIPAGRFGEGGDVAAGVVFLASREAGYVTGQTLHVNGGWP